MIAETPSAASGAPALVLTDPLPTLLPPWWQDWHAWAAILAGLLLIASAFVTILWIRKRINKPATPGAVALAALAKTENPVAVSRILRDYLAAVKPALRASLTTEEIVTLSSAGDKLPAEGWLPALRECDEAKYAGAGATGALAGKARELVMVSEKNLAEAALKRN